MSKHKADAVALTDGPSAAGQGPDRADTTSSVPLVAAAPPIAMAAPIPSPALQAPEPPPPTPEEIARAAGMKGKLLASASRNVVLKRGEAAVHAIFFVTASGEKYRVIDKEAVCIKGHGTKS